MKRLAAWVANRTLTDEKRLITHGPAGARRLVIQGAFGTALGLGAMWVFMWAPEDSLWQTLSGPLLGGILGSNIMRGLQRAGAYRNGWLAGRLHMLEGIKEADSPEEWLTNMTIYDGVHVLGLDVRVPDSPEDLEE